MTSKADCQVCRPSPISCRDFQRKQRSTFRNDENFFAPKKLSLRFAECKTNHRRGIQKLFRTANNVSITIYGIKLCFLSQHKREEFARRSEGSTPTARLRRVIATPTHMLALSKSSDPPPLPHTGVPCVKNKETTAHRTGKRERALVSVMKYWRVYGAEMVFHL